MMLEDVLQQLYECELNAGLQADWDQGLTVWIGGPVGTPCNQIRTHRTFAPQEFGQMAAWLDDEARRLFPGVYPPWDKRAVTPP